jgi:chitinase
MTLKDRMKETSFGHQIEVSFSQGIHHFKSEGGYRARSETQVVCVVGHGEAFVETRGGLDRHIDLEEGVSITMLTNEILRVYSRAGVGVTLFIQLLPQPWDRG